MARGIPQPPGVCSVSELLWLDLVPKSLVAFSKLGTPLGFKIQVHRGREMALLASKLRGSEGIKTSLWREPKEILATEDSAPEEPSFLPTLWPFKGHLNKSLHNKEPSGHLKPQTRPKKGKGTKNPQRHVTGSERITKGCVGNSPWMVLLSEKQGETNGEEGKHQYL